MTTDLRSTGAQRCLALEVTASDDVLPRVLGLLQRRRCRVIGVDYVARDRHYPGRLVIAVETPPDRAHCVEGWLGNLVDVIGVEAT
jgi:acetolactate synthase small subunit